MLFGGAGATIGRFDGTLWTWQGAESMRSLAQIQLRSKLARSTLSRLAVPSCLPVSHGKPPCLYTTSSLTRLKRRRSILTINRNLTNHTVTKSGEIPKNQ